MSDLNKFNSDLQAFMRKKKPYISPEVTVFVLDLTASLMMTSNPGGGRPRNPQASGSKTTTDPQQSPFASPFEKKPFN